MDAYASPCEKTDALLVLQWIVTLAPFIVVKLLNACRFSPLILSSTVAEERAKVKTGCSWIDEQFEQQRKQKFIAHQLEQQNRLQRQRERIRSNVLRYQENHICMLIHPSVLHSEPIVLFSRFPALRRSTSIMLTAVSEWKETKTKKRRFQRNNSTGNCYFASVLFIP